MSTPSDDPPAYKSEDEESIPNDIAETEAVLPGAPSETTALLGRPTSPNGSSERTLTLIQMVELNAFWYSYQLYWFLVFVVIVPRQIQQIAGDKGKGSAISLVSLFAGVINLFLAVFVGAMNDRVSGSSGKRHPWIVIGSIGMCLCLFLLWPTNSLWFYVIGYGCLTASTVIASVPFNGLIADVTPTEQKARVSAIMGGMNLIGYLSGAVVGIFAEQMGTVPLYIFMCTCVCLGTYLTVGRGPREPEKNYVVRVPPPIEWKPFLIAMVSPLWLHRDFALVFTSRFLFQLGIATIQQFMQYWISDCVSTTFPPQRAVSVALLPLFILSPIAAFFLPPTNRKLTVYLSTCLMIITCLILISAHTFAFALLASAVFGAGYGPFLSTEFAMLMDVLPNQVDAAKDMSLWHSALVWPQIIALPIAGFIRDAGQSWGEGGDFPENMHCPGYMLIFAICIVYFVAGASVTKAIRGVV